jgi:hypothetical protein
MSNNNDKEWREHKKGQYHEFINFAIQGMEENAQFSIAIAVGIFGILAIFASINMHNKEVFWRMLYGCNIKVSKLLARYYQLFIGL